MAPRLVKNTLLQPDLTPIVGATIEIQLVADASTGRGEGWIPGSESSVIWRKHVRSQAPDEDDLNGGLWSVELEPNANIEPANTYYKVTENPPGRHKAETYYIQVPVGTGDLWVRDILVEEPASPEPLYLLGSQLEDHVETVKDHDDWSDTAPATGQVPIWNGSAYVPGDTVATDLEVTSAITTHNADTTDVHGIPDTSVLATDAEVASAVAAEATLRGNADTAHEADTTNIHGIADTSALVTDGDAAGGVLSGTYPSPGFAVDMATQAELDAEATSRAAGDAELRSRTDPEAAIPLVIPTYDDDPSAGHFDVLHVPEGWNGYRYWMAFTPYPLEARENPSIVASNDGVNWEEPPGIVNPVAPLADAVADGAAAQSDPDLVLLQNGTMALYYRGMDGAANEILYRRTSTDGVTWSARQLLYTTASPNYEYRSPAVVQVSESLFYMWTTTTTSGEVVRRTSTDGVTWDTRTVCTMPALTVWHLDVVKVGSRYHMLAATQNPWQLCYLYSDDGLTWKGSTAPAVPKTRLAADGFGHYRSSLVAVPGNPLRFKVWATGINANGGSGFDADAIWSGLFYDDLDLEAGLGRITLAVPDLHPTAGSPDISVHNTKWVGYNFDAAAIERVGATFRFPPNWRSARVSFYWVTASGTGNVVWSCNIVGVEPNLSLSTAGAGDDSVSSATGAAAGTNTLKATRVTESFTIDPVRLYSIRCSREGSNASDTYASDATLLAVVFERLS